MVIRSVKGMVGVLREQGFSLRALPHYRWFLWAQVAFAIVLPASDCSGAEPMAETSHTPVELSEIRKGRLLIRVGELERARIVLERARPSCDEQELERLLLLGYVELGLGIRERAVEKLEKVLTRWPSLARVVRRVLAAEYCLREGGSMLEQAREMCLERSAGLLLAAVRSRAC